MRVLILVPRQPRESGNWVSAERFARGLETSGHQICLAETDPEEPTAIDRALSGFTPDVALLLHAYRSGRPWLQSRGEKVPFAVLCTGTDHYLDRQQPGRQPVVSEIFRRAGAILSQNRPMLAELQLQAELVSKLHWLPVAASLGETPYDLASRISRRPGEILLLQPAGIRPVKRNLELLLLCDRLTSGGRRFRLLFCGPELDAEYAARFQSALAERPWACWLGSIPQPAMASLMRQVDVILNHSEAEGLANALVEAIALGRPVLARDIPGNAQLVEDGRNGLLYADDAAFLGAAERLLESPELRRELSCSPPDPVAPETEALERILAGLLAG